MHVAAFAFKRAHHAALRIERPVAAKYGLTPARFDMLYCIHLHQGTMFRQSTLRRILGITSPTASRMLLSLKELGLVLRCVDPDDERQLNVWLSPRGREVVAAVIDEVLGSGLLDIAFDVALAGRRWFDERVCGARVRSTTMLLRRVADTFYDTGSLDYGFARRAPAPVAILLRPTPAPLPPPPPVFVWPPAT